jgi:putative ABC transport system ATP-binding protein
MSETIIQAEHLSKTYQSGGSKIPAVRDVSIQIKRGEMVVITGPSGSGKTTLLSLLGCILKPDRGKLIVDGLEVTQFSEKRLPRLRQKHFGFIFQSFNLLKSLTTLQNVEVAYWLRGVRGKKARSKALSLLSQVGLAERASHLPNQLSGGEQQRVAIARSLAGSPSIIFADEPTGNLDSKRGAQIVRILSNLVEERQTAVVLVTHDLRLRSFADALYQLDDGKLTSGR